MHTAGWTDKHGTGNMALFPSFFVNTPKRTNTVVPALFF
jgi:hypothetical protein